MKKKLILFSLLVVIAVIATGCGPKIVKYDLKDLAMAQTNQKRQNLSVAVVRFQDKRPDYEKYSKNKVFSESSKTRDESYKDGDVAGGVTLALVDHCKHIKLFKSIEVLDISSSKSLSEILEELQGKEYDVLLTGTISHFFGIGYLTKFDKHMIAFSYIPGVNFVIAAISPLMLAEKNTHEGHIEIIDLRLTDISNAKCLWSGSFSEKMKMEYSDTYPAKAANETLKEVVKKIVKKIETVDFK